MKVSNMTSLKGNKISNQFVIEDNGRRIFQSYESVIAVIDQNGQVTLDEKYWDYSNTTRKYRNIFLGETGKETKEKIKQGIYRLCNLN